MDSKIYNVQIQVKLRFGMANSINTYLRPKNIPSTTQTFNL